MVFARNQTIGPRKPACSLGARAKEPQRRDDRRAGKAATELREAFGVRGACSRFRTTTALRQRQQAGRTPNASRVSSSGAFCLRWLVLLAIGLAAVAPAADLY